MTKPIKQVHLAAHFPGVNNTTVWSDPRSGSQTDFESFVRFARIAEDAKFDFLFLAEGLRLREQGGRIYDLDVVGRPDTFTILAAVAAVTTRLGLAGTINSTFNEPFEVARQFASLDHLSAGRAAWNVVTSWDAFTGENFRRGGYLAEGDRYTRASLFLEAATTLFDSWPDGPFPLGPDGAEIPDTAGRFEIHDEQFDLSGRFDVPRSPQGRPVIFQAGDSDAGREFAAAKADAIFSRHGTLEAGQAFHADVKRRLAAYGRRPEELLVLPAATFALGDTPQEAADNAHEVRLQQVSGATALRFAEQLWNADLQDLDPDGPLPSFDPVVSDSHIAKGRASVRQNRNPVEVANEWRELAEAKKLSLREVVIEKTGRQNFVGTPQQVADEINRYVQSDASDGFILVPHLVPDGLADFAATVVPLLQERGVYRTEYTGTTLREHLGLAVPQRRETAGVPS